VNKNRKPLSSQKQLANVYDSLADDILAGHIVVDEGTQQRASRVARKATDKAAGSGQFSDVSSEARCQKKWTKRTGKDASSVKGRVK
jgi:hypothetical protein